MTTNFLDIEVIDSFRDKYWFLSNFYPHEQRLSRLFIENNTTRFRHWNCPTLEHAFQMSKTENEDEMDRIAKASTPAMAKKIGREVKRRPDWDDARVQTMKTLLLDKFSDPAMKKLLLATGDAMLVEGNTWNDKFWGVCDGEGQNMLGKLLMGVRKTLKDEEPK